jgi:anthranilate phosphoribosyltransferase
MSIAHYIKEIGRGKDGARPLAQGQAYDLMSQVLDGRVTDLELGAFCVAMRIKGESIEELAGFMVVLPSYNGARKLPNLTPLLALLLAQDGIPVLVHGPLRDPGRVTSAQIFHDLGLPIAHDMADVPHAWSRREPVFMATDVLCPPLARLLEARWVIGLRNSGHTVAKLIDPTRGGAALRVCNYTHPEYGQALAQFLRHTQAHAVLMRGTEGEPVADPRRLPKLEVYLHGNARPDLSLTAQEGVLTELPVLPRAIDAATTAVYIQSVVSGEKPAPAPLLQQAETLRRAIEAWSETPARELSA